MKIVNILKSNLALTQEQGELIRDRIIKKFYHGKRATVDCGGLICMSTNFVQPISEITNLYPVEFRKKNLRFTNAGKSNRLLLERYSLITKLPHKYVRDRI